MTSCQLSSIAVRVENDQVPEQRQYPNARSVLVEIQHALERFNQHQQPAYQHLIDLGSIPMAAYERNKLIDLLGRGEVNITLSTLGKSEIYETALSGVWVVKHKDEEDNISAMFVEITRIPEIVLSQMDDTESLTHQVQEMMNELCDG